MKFLLQRKIYEIAKSIAPKKKKEKRKKNCSIAVKSSLKNGVKVKIRKKKKMALQFINFTISEILDDLHSEKQTVDENFSFWPPQLERWFSILSLINQTL